MKHHKFFILASVCLFLTSCTKFFMYTYGIRNPKIENAESILHYLKSKSLSLENNYCLKDTAELMAFFETKIGAPEIRFYDKNGFLMMYRDDKRCNGQNDSLISFLDPKNVVKLDSSVNFFEYLNHLRDLEGHEVVASDFRDQDYYLVIYWAKWLGKMNSVKLSDWEATLKSKNGLKIKTIKVSTDYMNFWKINKKEMIKVYSRKTTTEAAKR